MIADITTHAENGLQLMRLLEGFGLEITLHRAVGMYDCHRYTVEIHDPRERSLVWLGEAVELAGGQLYAAHTTGSQAGGSHD